jgi:hypothetical protein
LRERPIVYDGAMLRRSPVPLVLLAFAFLACAACGKKEKPTEGAASASPSVSPPGTTSAGTTPATVTPAAPAVVATPPGAPPPDGKYERVVIDGVTVPMIQVMNGGAIVLVDTDGKKPRTWEEQYKRKRNLPNGQYDLHKTNANGNDSFEDDAIDKEGLWVIDAKGNISKH